MSDSQDVKGPFTSRPLRPGSSWYGLETQNVYDGRGTPLCVVPRIYHYDRERRLAKGLAKAVAEALTDVGFEFDARSLTWSTALSRARKAAKDADRRMAAEGPRKWTDYSGNDS